MAAKKIHSARNLFPIYLKLWSVNFSNHFWTVCRQCWLCEFSYKSVFRQISYEVIQHKVLQKSVFSKKHRHIMNKLKRLTHSCATDLKLQNMQDMIFMITICLDHLWCDRGTRWRSWLRHCAASRKVVGSIPDGVIGIFHWHNPSGRTMALVLTQPLTEMSTRNISWG